MFLLDDLILAPVKGIMWLAEQVQEEANSQLFDVPAIKARLAEVQELYDEGLISEAQLCKAEEKLLARLNAAQERESDKNRAKG
jgi:cytochrome c-type biogenesis protein CcmH/NrfG